MCIFFKAIFLEHISLFKDKRFSKNDFEICTHSMFSALKFPNKNIFCIHCCAISRESALSDRWSFINWTKIPALRRVQHTFNDSNSCYSVKFAANLYIVALEYLLYSLKCVVCVYYVFSWTFVLANRLFFFFSFFLYLCSCAHTANVVR